MASRRTRALVILALVAAAALGLWLALGRSGAGPDTAPHVDRAWPMPDGPRGDEPPKPALTGRAPVPAVPTEESAGGVGLSLLARHAGYGGHAKQFSFVLSREGFRRRVSTETGVVWGSVPAAGRYDVSEIEADGVRYVALPAHVDVDGKSQGELVLELPGRIELRVRAADTKEPVAFPRAVRVREHEQEPVHFPWRRAPGLDPVIGDAHGILSLPEARSGWRWFVVAEGFAWRRVEVVAAVEPGTLLLERGGTLALRIAGWQGLTDATLTLWRKDEVLELRPPGEDGVLELEGLPVGQYVLRVQRGHWVLSGPRYAEVRFEIRAAQRTPLEVAAVDPVAGRQSRLRGDLVVPPGWTTLPEFMELLGDSSQNHGIELIVSLQADPLRPRRFTFESKPVPWGTYLATVNALRWHQRVRIPAEPVPLELRPPPPARILVQVHTVKDGNTLPDATVSLHWSNGEEPEDDEGWARPGTVSASFDPAMQGFNLQAAPGTVTLNAQAPGHVATRASMNVAAGAELKHTFSLVLAARLVVHVLEGGKPSTAEVVVWVAEEDGKRGYESKTGKVTMEDLEPGEHTVEVEVRTPGYEKVPLRTVRLVGGETTEIVADLKRSPR